VTDLSRTDLDKETISKAYARWAPVYDLVFGAVFERGREAAVAAAERVGGRILEVGIGTGMSLADYSRTSRICGVDISEPMLRKAQERVLELGLSNVEGLWVMDAEHLSFPDASFDVVVAQYVITTVPNPEATLDECARILKPGGEIVLVSPGGRGSGIAARLGAVVHADGAQARLAHGILLRALRALGRADARHAADRAARHAAVRAFLAHPLRQDWCDGRPRGKTGDTRRSLIAFPPAVASSAARRAGPPTCHIGFIEST